MDNAGSLPVIADPGRLRSPIRRVSRAHRRLAASGSATMHDDSELSGDFFVAAHLTGPIGRAKRAEARPWLKALFNPKKRLSLHFDDVVANRAGLAFAMPVLDRPDYHLTTWLNVRPSRHSCLPPRRFAASLARRSSSDIVGRDSQLNQPHADRNLSQRAAPVSSRPEFHQ